jgi:hypothetical protein
LYGEDEALEPKSDIDGRELRGGTKTVEREPVLELLVRLSTDIMVLIEPVIEGERATEDDSGKAMGRLTASLLKLLEFSKSSMLKDVPKPVHPLLPLE